MCIYLVYDTISGRNIRSHLSTHKANHTVLVKMRLLNKIQHKGAYWLIALMMVTVSTSETSVNGAVSQKAVIFILAAKKNLQCHKIDYLCFPLRFDVSPTYPDVMIYVISFWLIDWTLVTKTMQPVWQSKLFDCRVYVLWSLHSTQKVQRWREENRSSPSIERQYICYGGGDNFPMHRFFPFPPPPPKSFWLRS